MKTINFSETGNDLAAVLARAAEAEDAVTVLNPGGVPFVVLTSDQYRGLMETSHLLSSPANAAHLAQSLAELREGRVSERELIDAGGSDAKPVVHK